MPPRAHAYLTHAEHNMFHIWAYDQTRHTHTCRTTYSEVKGGKLNPRSLHYYSVAGAALLVSAPGGDHEFSNNHVVAKPGGVCGDAGVGTSYSTPVVSGVVALMLEANPQLTWRDVQGVLVTTSSHKRWKK